MAAAALATGGGGAGYGRRRRWLLAAHLAAGAEGEGAEKVRDRGKEIDARREESDARGEVRRGAGAMRGAQVRSISPNKLLWESLFQ